MNKNKISTNNYWKSNILKKFNSNAHKILMLHSGELFFVYSRNICEESPIKFLNVNYENKTLINF